MIVDVKNTASISATGLEEIKLSYRCSQKAHSWCKGKIGITKKQKTIEKNQLFLKIKQKYPQISDKALRVETDEVFKKIITCECFCHLEKAGRK